MIQVKYNKVLINNIDNNKLSKGAVIATVQELRIHGEYNHETKVSIFCPPPPRSFKFNILVFKFKCNFNIFFNDSKQSIQSVG